MKGPIKLSEHIKSSPGEKVPRGGTMCANCEYLVDAQKKICGEPNFIAWNGSKFIPTDDVHEYCSIWWSPKKEQARQRFDSVRDSQEKG